jgi:hypothetical protein
MLSQLPLAGRAPPWKRRGCCFSLYKHLHPDLVLLLTNCCRKAIRKQKKGVLREHSKLVQRWSSLTAEEHRWFLEHSGESSMCCVYVILVQRWPVQTAVEHRWFLEHSGEPSLQHE